MSPLRVGILGSTRGTASAGIIAAIEANTLDAQIVLVLSDKPTAPILQRAATHHLPSLFLNPTGLSRSEFDTRVTAALRSANADLVLMIGYMRIVTPAFVAAWSGRLLNVHPSLLPAFAGLMNARVHEAVLAAGVPETGCTIHQVTDDVDGGAFVLQKRCPVLPGDTVESLKDRVQTLEQLAFLELLQTWKP